MGGGQCFSPHENTYSLRQESNVKKWVSALDSVGRIFEFFSTFGVNFLALFLVYFKAGGRAI